MPVTYNWQRLSPQEFVLLQEIVSYSGKKLKEVLLEFEPNGCLARFNPEEATDFDGFLMFTTTYLGCDVPEDLLRHLFLCFTIKPLSTSASTSGLEPHSSNPNANCDPKHHNITLTASASNPSLATVNGNGTGNGNGTDPLPTVNPTPVPVHHGSRRKSNPTLLVPLGHAVEQPSDDESQRVAMELREVHLSKVYLKDLICYLSIMEAGKPEEKLEFMFKLYDRDENGSLDANEIESIINQMMAVAEFLEWDVTELRPVLQDMMKEIDYDDDGTVSLEEWKRGGLTTIPLLVLLGIDETVRDDGVHVWALKHFKKLAHCNVCQEVISGMRKQGLSCTFCKYAVHQRCAQKAAANCITTYTKTRKTGNTPTLAHHWVSGTCSGKCEKCKRTIKVPNGQRCRWCKGKVCSKCASSMKQECDLGRLRKMILPPTCIFPAVFERKSITAHHKQHQSVSEKMPSVGVTDMASETPTQERSKPVAASSFQIECSSDISPLFVFTNPKSGGKQGITLFRKFQYLLNPRQVFDLIKCKGPMQGLLFLKDIKGARILCAGGDGTVGWLLEVMDKLDWPDGRPPVGVLPLGTGNDLARTLSWGSGYEGESLTKILDRLERATLIQMDRWKIDVSEAPKQDDDVDSDECKEPDEHEKDDPVPSFILNNYFSIGLDASIAYRFHNLRERHPEKFKTRMRNKVFYFEFGMAETFTTICKNLHQYVDIMVDGIPLDISHGTPLEGIAILNIPSIYGGTNLWGPTSKSKQQQAHKHSPSPKQNGVQPQSGGWKHSHMNLQDMPRDYYSAQGLDMSCISQDLADGLMEVVGIESTVQLAQIRVGVRNGGIRLAQCRTVTIRTKRRFPMQIDGEPWMQSACTIHISHKNKVPMYLGPKVTEKKSWFNFSSKSRDAGSSKTTSDQSS